jgi:hypothetical protein
VVHEDYDAALQSNLPIGSGVVSALAAADGALAAGQYVTAYDDYATAYRGIA